MNQIREEILYQKHTHPADADARSDLYKVNKKSQTEMVESLTVIFGEENLSVNEAVIFPGEDEIIEMLKEEEAMETESG